MQKPPASTTLSVLRHLDVYALRSSTRAESRSRQRHLPPISVYRWWARRTESVSGAIIDALSRDAPGRLLLADPFAGGGVIALAALVRGHRVYAQDVNPWATRCLATMLDLPGPDTLAVATDRLRGAVDDMLAAAYSTTLADGTPGLISHMLRVATAPCPGCSRTLRLFPTAIVSLTHRVDCGGDSGYMACPAGHLNLASATKRTSCETCNRYVYPSCRYTSGRTARCVECGWAGRLTDLAGAAGFLWEPVLVDRVAGGRREIGTPTSDDLCRAGQASWTPQQSLPAIDDGVETRVLLCHGMRRWHDLYPNRQRVVLEALLGASDQATGGDERVARALEAAIIGSAEMAGFVSRWDARYLKAYEAVANHRYSFTTLAAEPNVWGADEHGRGTVQRRLELFAKAAVWLEERVGRPLNVEAPVCATSPRVALSATSDARVVSGSSARMCIPARGLSAVLTDPPYHDDVHYGELSDIFRAWAGESPGSLAGDAIVRTGAGPAGTAAYQKLLTDVFLEIRRALRPGGHFVLSYANRQPQAWAALFSALQDAGFRTVGYTVVESENETDHAKAGRRSCNLDVLIDLVVDAHQKVRQYKPKGEPTSDEDAYCRIVGGYALRVGKLKGNWRNALDQDLRASRFLSRTTR